MSSPPQTANCFNIKYFCATKHFHHELLNLEFIPLAFYSHYLLALAEAFSGLSPRTASLYLLRYSFKGSTYLSNPSVDIAHNKSSPFIVFRFSCRHLSDASDVIKLMNSETHSCTVSFESFAIFAFSGNVFFIIRAIFAIGK